MKKKILIGIIAVITVICAFSFTACNDECDHQWTDASCTAPKTCSICQETEGQANGHSYKTDFDKNESQHWYVCSVCGDKKDAAEHTFNVPAATEQTDKYCTVCNYIAEYQLGHVHTYDSVLSYDEEGHYYAATCGHTELKKDFAFHSFSTNTVAPTCTEQGYTTHTCDCGKVVKDEYTAACGHQFHTTFTKDGAGHWFAAKCIHSTERKEYSAHNYVATVTEPTCTAQGYTTYTCACGDSYVSDYVDAKGHSVATWTEDSCELYDARSCKHEVVYSGLCSGCQTVQTKTEYIEIHAFTEKTVTAATCISEGTLHKMCKNESCKYFTAPYEIIKYTDVNAHNWVKDAQNSSGGVTAYKCNNSACTATKKTVTGGESASVPKDTIGTIDEIKLDNATIGLDEDIKDKLSKTGADVSISAGTLDGSKREAAINSSNLTDEQKELLGKNKIYNFTLNGGDVEKLGGDATIRIPYNLAPGEDPDNIIVWYVKAGKIVPISGVYTDDGSGSGSGYVTFTTDHFSYYTVTTLSPEKLCQHLGHDLKNAHTVLPTCTDIGYTLCLRCGNQVEDSITAALGHSWQTTVISESSCSESGVTEYCCSACELSYETVIAATGHYFVLTAQVNASCAESGSMTYDCLYCTEGYSVTLPQLSHTYVSKTVAPTCEERGYTEKTCTGCGDTVYVYYTPALGHTPDTEWHKDPSGHYHVCITCGVKQTESAHVPGPEATEQSAQICTVCEYVIVPQLSHTHSLTKVDGTPADCVNLGNIEYYTCVCGKWFTDAAGTQLITNHASVIIDAKGHTYESLPYVEPTCTAVGYTAGVKCSVCETLIRGHVEISAHGHNYIITETAPSCTEAGKITEVCSYCDDAKPEKTVDALGHKYISSITAPTCTEDGYTTFTCARCNDSKKDDEKAALGHNYAAGWLSDKDGHWHECSRCQLKADDSEHTPDRPAATEEKAKTCSKCGYVIEERLNHVHSVKTAIDEKASTCTAGGNLAYYICDCGEWFYDEDCEQLIVNTDSVRVKPLSHKLSYVEETEPDCTEVGYTAGYYCDRCETYLSGHEEIPATGHSHSEEWSSDENEHWRECSACGDKADKTVHNWNVTEATEENAKYCTVCEYVAEEKLPHTHKFNNWIDEIPASCTEEGTLGHYECPCGKLFNENKEEITDLVISSTGHNHSDEWSSDENEHWHECACGDKADKTVHSWNVTEATEESAKYCTVCEYVAEEKLPHTHKFNNWIDEIPASCTEEGTLGHYECPCGKLFNENKEEITDLVIPATGHNHSDEWSSNENEHWHECACGDKADKTVHNWNVTEATEENAKYCTVCEYVAEEKLPHTHKFNNWIEEIPASCTEEGTLGHYECPCGKFFNENKEEITDLVIPKENHAYSDEWSSDENEHWHECVCGDKADKAAHSFVDGKCETCESSAQALYTYTMTSASGEMLFTFIADGELTGIGWQYSLDGQKIDVNEKGTWVINSNGEIEATARGLTQLFIINSDGTLALKKDECTHEHKTIETVDATCETPGYEYTKCSDCGNIVDVQTIPALGHNYNKVTGICVNCGQSEGGQGGEEETEVLYTYVLKNEYASLTYSFMSDYTFTIVGNATSDGKPTDINETGTWTIDSEGYLAMTLYGETQLFIIGENGELTPKQNGGTNVGSVYMYIREERNMYLELYFMSDGTLTMTGWRINENDAQEDVFEEGTWFLNKDGYVEATMYGETMLFVIGKDGMLTPKDETGDEPEVTESYNYTVNHDYADMGVSFWSDNSFTAKGWYIDENDEKHDVDENGTWRYINDNTISAYICGDNRVFEIDSDGNLTLKDNEGDEPEQPGENVRYTYYIDTDDESLTILFMSDKTLTVTGWRFNANGEKEKVNYSGTWSINEATNYVEAVFNGKKLIFTQLGVSDLMLRGEGYISDSEEITTLYTYTYKTDAYDAILTFMSDQTLIASGWRLTAEGMKAEPFTNNGGWYIDGEDFIVADIGANYGFFILGADGSLTLREDCTHEKTDTNTYGLSCLTHGYEETYCLTCYSVVSSRYVEPSGHKYESGVCTECGANESDPAPKELYTYNPKNENGSYVLSFLDNFIFSFTLTEGYIGDGIELNVPYYGTWSYYNDTTIETTIFGESFETLTVNEDGTLSEYQCKHENTCDDTVDAGCDKDGYIRIYCEDCGEVISDTPIPATGHVYENGHCVNCGRVEENKPEIEKTVVYVYNDGSLSLTLYSDYSAEGSRKLAGDSMVDSGLSFIPLITGYWEQSAEGNEITVYTLFKNYIFSVTADGVLTLTEEKEVTCSHEKTTVSTVAPSCETNGCRKMYCDACGDLTYVALIPATGHNFINGKCEICGKPDKGNEGGTDEPGEACPHKNTTKDGVPATCLLSGYEFYSCLDCYSFVSEKYLDPTGHNFGEDGICTECGANESDPEPKELYKYEYANAEEGIKYVMSFLDNGVFTLNMLEGQVEEGIEKDFFAGEWHTNEGGTISAYLFGSELYRFAIGEDGTLSEYECKHENTYENNEEPGCDRDGVKRVFCEDCGMLISETSIPATGHNFNENGFCSNCGQSSGSGDETVKTVKYFYSDTTFTLTFYSDYSVDGTVKTPSADGMSFMQKVFGSWSHNYASGGISVQLNNGEKLEFEIANGKDLVLVGQSSGNECKHEGELVIVTKPATCTEWGYRMENCPSCGYTVNKEEYEPLGHDFNENGVCLACGEKESVGEPETLYTYTLKKENLYAELTFTPGYSATAKGWYIDENGEKYDIDEEGGWSTTESGKIYAYFYEVLYEYGVMYFTLNEDGSLTLYVCNHENSITEGFDATCTLSGYKFITCDECGEFLSDEYLDPTGHSFDENGICTDCGANKSDPEPKELYKYEYTNAEEGISYVLSFLDNNVFTLNVLEGQIEDGVDKDFFVGEWYTNGDGTISARLFGNELYRFTVGEDGTLSEYECKHKKTFESSESATCEKDGIIITICYDCYEVISSTVIPATGHKYGEDGRCTNCGYSESGEAPDICYHHDTFNYTIDATCTVSGFSITVCGNCGTELSEGYYTEPTGHNYDENGVCVDCGRSQSEPEPTEVYSFVYKDEYTSYNFSFMSDNTYYFTGDERTADGNVISQSFYATWSLTEDGTILDAYLLDEPFISFEVDADGKLTMIIPSDDEIPADCSHANTYDETEEPLCNKDGYTRIYCGDCGLLLSDMPISSKGHSYDDNGICVNCGYSENKDITVTPGYGYDLAA